MQTRIKIDKVEPAGYSAVLGLEKYIESTTLTRKHKDLIKIRSSQINGCAFCIDMHTKDARASGETEQRLYLLPAWRDANSIYNERERAALAWTEAVTLLVNQQVPDEIYDAARKQFSEQELLALTLAIVAIDGWNRFNIAMQTPAGGYQPGSFSTLTKETFHA